MPDDSTLHRGDIALLDAMTVTAARAQYLNLLGALDYRSGEITADDIRGVEDVLHRTLGQADWLARGTRGLVLLLDYCVNQVLANETRLDPGHANSMAVQALVLDFCRRHWPDRVTVVRAAGEGLAACVALLRTHGGDTNGPGEGNKGLVRTILSQMDGECLRGALESALEQAHCDRDRLALAGAALGDMERLLSNKGEPAWQPSPECVAWLACGLTCPHPSDSSQAIRNAAWRAVPKTARRPAPDATPDGNAIEWVLAACRTAVVGWNDSEATRFLKAEAACRQMEAQLAGEGCPAQMALDTETVAWVRSALGDALAMRRAGRALARHNGGGSKKRNRRLA